MIIKYVLLKYIIYCQKIADNIYCNCHQCFFKIYSILPLNGSIQQNWRTKIVTAWIYIYICSYLVSSVHELKFSEINTFEKARLFGLELRRKHGMSHNTANQLRSEISRINNNHISKLRSKFISLCNNSRWKKLGWADLVNNISSINLSPTETEALSFGLKFATDIKSMIWEK